MASTCAVGRLLPIRSWQLHTLGESELKDLAPPSLPNRMARLSNTARPHTSMGRAAPMNASAVIR